MDQHLQNDYQYLHTDQFIPNKEEDLQLMCHDISLIDNFNSAWEIYEPKRLHVNVLNAS